MSTIDLDVLQFLNALAWSKRYWYAFAYFLSSYLIILLIVGTLIYLVRHRDTERLLHARRSISYALVSVVVATTIGFLLAAFINRARPYNELGPMIDTIGRLPGNSSFPSAHTWISFAFAGTFLYITEYRRLGYCLLLLALLVAIGRVMVGFHYPSDVLGGALLGLSSASLVVHLGPRVFVWLSTYRQGKG